MGYPTAYHQFSLSLALRPSPLLLLLLLLLFLSFLLPLLFLPSQVSLWRRGVWRRGVWRSSFHRSPGEAVGSCAARRLLFAFFELESACFGVLSDDGWTCACCRSRPLASLPPPPPLFLFSATSRCATVWA